MATNDPHGFLFEERYGAMYRGTAVRGVEQRDRVAAPLPRRHVDNRRSALCQLCISINRSVMFPGHGEQSIKDIDA